MKSRPAILTILGYLFCLEPIARIGILSLQGQTIADMATALQGSYALVNLLGLVLFPSIGLMLLHPNRNTRTGIIIGLVAYYGINTLYLTNALSQLTSSQLIFYVTSMLATFTLISIILSSKLGEVFSNDSIRWWQQAKRFKLMGPADIRPLVSKQLEDLHGEMCDISFEGARIFIDNNQLQEKDTLKLQVAVGEINLNLLATVVKKYENGELGLQFQSLNAQKRKLLEKVLDSLEILETTLDRSRPVDLLERLRKEVLA